MATRSFVELRLDTARLGIALQDVDHVLRAAALSPVPGAHACLLGILDLRGEPVPVYDTRRLLGLPTRELQPQDRFVLARSGSRRVAFVADEVSGIVEADEQLQGAGFAAAAAGVRGVAASPDGMLLVQDFKRFHFLEHAIPIGNHA